MMTLTDALLPPVVYRWGSPGKERSHRKSSLLLIGHWHQSRRDRARPQTGQGSAVWAAERYFYNDYRVHRWKIPDPTRLRVVCAPSTV